jgi:WD40 repeat protein
MRTDVIIWDATTWTEAHRINASDDGITSVAWNSDGSVLAATGSDGVVRLWDGADYTLLDEIVYSSDEPFLPELSWQPDSNLIIIGTNAQIEVVDTSTGQILFTDVLPELTTMAGAAISQDGTVLYSTRDAPIVIEAAVPPTPDPSAADALRDFLTDPSCEQACIFGIQPGVTTQTDVEHLLAANNITPDIISVGDITTYTWFLTPTPVFISEPAASDAIIVNFRADVLEHIKINATIPIRIVREAFGDPEDVRVYDGLPSLRDYWLVYPSLGLVFGSDATAPSRTIVSIYIMPPHIVNNDIINSASTLDVDQPCPDYGTPPCIAPTAIPPD